MEYPRPKPPTQEQQINASMDRKELSIRVAGSVRDAVMITTAKMQHEKMTDKEIQAELLKWKKYIYQLNSPNPF